jgi:peptidoglycan/LPS O-acetylase OafA/YrhL
MNNKNHDVIAASSNGRPYLAECESLRGLAIALVVVFHTLIMLFGIETRPQLPWYLSIWFSGNTGVTLFFVLSGFLLIQPFMRATPYSIPNFYWNRGLRILPLYWLTVLAGAIYHRQVAAAAPALLFMNIDITTLPPFGSVWWSLVVEAQFYLLLPGVIWLFRRDTRRYWLVIAGGLLLLGYGWVAAAPPQHEVYGARDSIIGRWPAFACGIGAAWLHAHHHRLAAHVRHNPYWGSAMMLLPLTGLAIIADRITAHYSIVAHTYWFHHYALEAMLWALFLLAVITFSPPVKRLFINPVFHHLGTWSYSLYLLHLPLLYFTMKQAPIMLGPGWREEHLPLVLIAYVAVTAGCSALSYRYIELPFLRLKRPTHDVSTNNVSPIPVVGKDQYQPSKD